MAEQVTDSSTVKELNRLKHLAHEVRRTKGGFTAHNNFHNALSPEMVLILVHCTLALRELYTAKVKTLIPEDNDFEDAWIALGRLESECLPLF